MTLDELRRSIDWDEHRLAAKKITVYMAESIERGADWEMWLAMQSTPNNPSTPTADRGEGPIDHLKTAEAPSPGSPYEQTAMVAAQILALREFESSVHSAGRWAFAVSCTSMIATICAIGVAYLNLHV